MAPCCLGAPHCSANADIFRSGVTIPAMKEQIPPNGLNPVAAPTDSAQVLDLRYFEMDLPCTKATLIMCPVEQAFIEGFYDTSETSPGELRGCYADSAMMSFNGDTFTGKDAIMQKFAGLPMTQVRGRCQHAVIPCICI